MQWRERFQSKSVLLRPCHLFSPEKMERGTCSPGDRTGGISIDSGQEADETVPLFSEPVCPPLPGMCAVVSGYRQRAGGTRLVITDYEKEDLKIYCPNQ